MTDELIVQQDEPQGEPAQNPAESAQQPGAEQPAQEAPAADDKPSEPASGDADKPKKDPWWQTRLGEVSAKKNEAEARARVLEEQVAALLAAQSARGETPPEGQHPAAPKPAEPKPLNQADIDKLVQQRAAELARAQQFTDACDRAWNAGLAEFPDFRDAVKNLDMLGAVGKNANPAFLEIVTDMPDGHRVIHHLGKNLDDAARLVNLPPTKLAMELARIEASLGKPAAPKPLSNAPAPIRTVDGKGKAEPRLDDNSLPTDKWMELRRKQKAERSKR